MNNTQIYGPVVAKSTVVEMKIFPVSEPAVVYSMDKELRASMEGVPTMTATPFPSGPVVHVTPVVSPSVPPDVSSFMRVTTRPSTGVLPLFALHTYPLMSPAKKETEPNNIA